MQPPPLNRDVVRNSNTQPIFASQPPPLAPTPKKVSPVKAHNHSESESPHKFTSQVKSILERSELATCNMKRRRELLGPIIFSYTQKLVDHQSAPKITGMLLGMDSADFELTINNYDLFRSKALEAQALLSKQAKFTSHTIGAVSGVTAPARRVVA